MKIVINRCYGCFGVSKAVYDYIGIEYDPLKPCPFKKDRTNSKLVEAVEVLGEKANGMYADLVVIEIPDDLDYIIDDYDGMERVIERSAIYY